MPSLQCGKPSEPPGTVIAAPWPGRKSSSNLKLLGHTKEDDETQCLHGQPEGKLPRFSHLPTRKKCSDAFQKLQSFKLFALPAPTKHITSGEESTEKTPITDTNLIAGDLRPLEDVVRCPFPWGRIMGGLKKIRLGSERKPWWSLAQVSVMAALK